MSAANSTTVDWTRWSTERDELLKQYRAIVGAEINRAKLNHWQRFNLAIRFPFTWRDKLKRVAHG